MEPNSTAASLIYELRKIISNWNYNQANKVRNTEMVKVEFLGPIGKDPVEMEADTLADVSAKLKEDSALTQWLDKCAVALNDTMVNDLDTVLKDGDRISILPPVCGG